MKAAFENPNESLFANDIFLRYPSLKGGKFWKEEHDLVLLRAVQRYARFVVLADSNWYERLILRI